MSYITAGLLLMIAAFIFAREKKIYNPRVLFCGLWGILTIIYSFRLYDLNEVSDYTFLVIIIGTVCFLIGGTVRKKYKLSFSTHFTKRYSDYELNYLFLMVWFGLVLAFSISTSRRTFALLASGRTMDYIRFNYINLDEGVVLQSGFSYLFENYCCTPSEFAGIALLPIVFGDRKNRKSKIVMAEIIAFLVFHFFVTGARSFIVDVILMMLFFFLINSSLRKQWKEYFDKVPKIVWVAIVAAAVGFAAYTTTLRKGDDSVTREIYIYLAMAFPLLDIHLGMLRQSLDFTYGWTTLYGLLRPPFSMLHSLGFPYPAGLEHAMELINANNIFYSLGGIAANSFVSIFYYWMMDLGWLSLIIGAFVYGYFAESMYRRMLKSPNRRNQAVYLLVLIGLLLSFTRNHFTAFRYVYAFFIVLMSFRGKNKDYLEKLIK